MEELLFEVTERFYHEYSALVNETLRKVPKEFQCILAERIQEKSNIYSRDDQA